MRNVLDTLVRLIPILSFAVHALVDMGTRLSKRFVYLSITFPTPILGDDTPVVLPGFVKPLS
jgi:hypothetical protein